MKPLFEQICGFLDDRGCDYQPDSEQQRLILQIESLTVVIDISENGEFVKIVLPQLLTISDDHPHYEAALQTLLHLGWQYKLARWQRSPEDGEVRLQADLPLEDSELTEKQFWRTLQGTLQIAQRGRERVRGVLETGEDSGNSENQDNQGFLALLTEIATEARQGVRESLAQRLDLLTAALEAEYRSNSNPAQVYPLLDSAPQLLDDEFAEALQCWGAIALSPQRPEAERNRLAAYLGNFAIHLSGYPRTHPSILQKLAIVGYQLVLRVYPRETMADKHAQTLTNLGNAYLTQAELGENPSQNLQQAITAYDQAAEIRRRLGLEKDLSTTLTNLGNAYLTQAQLGENPSQNLQQAITAYHQAAEIFRRLGLEKDLSTTLTNLGIAYLTQASLGENPSQNLQQAITAYHQAAEIRRRLGLEKDVSQTLTNLGNAYLTQAQLGENPSQNLQKAITAYHQAAEIFRRLGLEKDLSTTLTNLGIAYSDQAQLGENPSQNLQQAITAYHQAAEIFRRLRLEKDLSTTLNNLGIAYCNQAELGENPSQNRKEAVNCYREALQFFRPQILPVECLTTARALGNLGFQQGDWQMALEGYQTAMDAIDYSRTQRLKNAEREEVVAQSIYIYENAIQAAINLDDIPTALEIVERVRAKRLVDLMATADLYADGNIPPQVQQWLQQLDRLDDEIAQKRNEFKDNSGEMKEDGLKTRQLRAATTVSTEIAEIESQKQAILDQLSNVDEVVAKLRQVQPPKLSDFQPLLSKKTALVSFYTTRNDTHIFILRSGESQPHRFTCKGQGYKTLQQWLRETWMRPYLSNKTQWTKQMPDTLAEIAHRLELNRLITEYLQDMEELVIVPHLFLHQIPFVALPISGEKSYLGDKFLIRYAPSLQVLGFCHHRDNISISDYGTAENATDDLPFSGFEGLKVAELFKINPQRRLIGSAANRQNYRELIQQVNRLVSTHHAQSRFDNPQESGLKLSDGTISVSQLFSPGWRFPQLEEVFLSCCETGLFSPNSAIDEPVALSTGFLCAGARGVIASQWAIYDCSAALLSILYHEQRKGGLNQVREAGLNRVRALQAAQQKMRQMTGAEFNEQYKIPLLKHLKKYFKQKKEQVAYDQKLVTCVSDQETKRNEIVQEYANYKGCPFEHPVHWGALGCYGLG
ncbi:CHAT domain-containing protein [Limnoraphis robusta]|uniref:CHAT domain-containing protein n=1 Tax=Limnoraphis robusta CCNP1315 TaxID=3110306 RepID=A0ABU5TWX4_9CYAN|nr:CHAT domain-containing protein [Limnoraphis robusta]MEA5519401.1 CHAT domain-containing protein [Limnoraphis robusta CCNP1315]MEA5544510.1 CHAT domain-containing protein [Limnoraphis robusta CCNP1324]